MLWNEVRQISPVIWKYETVQWKGNTEAVIVDGSLKCQNVKLRCIEMSWTQPGELPLTPEHTLVFGQLLLCVKSVLKLSKYILIVYYSWIMLKYECSLCYL